MDVFLERKIKMVGIIDIGTNTIRLVVYENNKKIIEKGVASEILKYTENKILSKTGIEKLCNSIIFLVSMCKSEEIHIIATQAFRALENKEEVKKDIFSSCGIDVKILSGEEEAECVFYGVMGEIGKEKSGIIADLGGGSLEIINFADKMVKDAKSYPIGTKAVKNKFSKDIIPIKAEIDKIENHIEETLKTKFNEGKLYMAGGTGKTALKICNNISGEEKNFIKVEEIEKILSYIESIPKEKLKEVFKNRYDSIYTGIIIIRKLAEIAGKKEIYIIKSGVREGYLKKEMKF